MNAGMQVYYAAAVKAISGLKYYYGDLKEDTVTYLLHYFPFAVKDELRHAVEWAIADVFGDGYEVES